MERRQRALSKRRAQCPPDSQSPQSSTLVALPSSLAEPAEHRELCCFVSSYVLYPRDPQADRGFVELLPLLFASLRPNSPLSLSLTAVSRCQFVAWEVGLRDVETPQVRLAYGKALAATRLALQDPLECSTDETLMAVCLLGFYEVRLSSEMSSEVHGLEYPSSFEAFHLWATSLILLGYRGITQGQNIACATLRRRCHFDKAAKRGHGDVRAI